MENSSKKYQLNSIDWQKIGVGAAIAISGALLTYLQDLIPQVDFGAWTPVAVSLNSIIVNAGRKFIAEYSK